MSSALVFDVARGSEVDGPGLRTTIFFKGCPLRCAWCHNPEGLRPAAEIAFFADRCHHHRACAEACPRDAIDLDAADRVRRFACDACGDCADVCDALALRRVGRPYSLARLEELVLRDRSFFAASGGGVTFSGGEPLLHPTLLGRLARRLQGHGIHVAVETCGDYDPQRFRAKVQPWVDLVLFDVKLVDPEAHRRWTGRGNRRILANLTALAAAARRGGPELQVRVPLVPGATASRDNLARIASLLRSLDIRSYALLGYNPSGLGKWRRLGRTSPSEADERPLPLEDEQRWRRVFDRLMDGGGTSGERGAGATTGVATGR